MKRISVSIAVALFLMAGGMKAVGDSVIAYTASPYDNSPELINYYGSAGYNLGLAFTVNTSITVDYMGVYDPTGTTTIPHGTNMTIALWDITTNTEVAGTQVTFSSAGGPYTKLGSPNDLFQSIAPVTLAASTDLYEVDAVGWNSNWPWSSYFGNAHAWYGPSLTGIPELTYIGSTYFASTNLGYQAGSLTTALEFPAEYELGAAQFEAGDFAFESPIPEPGTVLLMGTGAMVLAGLVRRRLHPGGVTSARAA
ncbi:MAG: PEP-CTERM sorting domain-containing protein [Terracidiphilus sp.]|jgi:hypothetical protein